MIRRFWIFAAMLLSFGVMGRAADSALGLFTDQSDVGAPSSTGPGSAVYDADKKAYTISGGGENLWLTADAFHFVWKKVPATGDISLAATIDFSPATAGADPHRKAVLMIRQSLDPGSPYADACIHGNGLTAIQWRDTKGEATYETQAQANAPKRVLIEKRGDYLSMSFGSSDKDLQPAGGACKVQFTGEMYIGLGVCAHNAARIEKAVFSDVAIGTPAPITGPANRAGLVSTLETIQLSSKDRRAVYVVTQPQLTRAEAPNWSADNMLYFNTRGKMFKIKADLPASTPPTAALAAPVAVDLGILTNINNDHAISPDGKTLGISDQSQGNRQSAVWVVPIEGAGSAAPKRLTENTPSYFHGWSPDGKTLAFCGQRNNVFNIYTIGIDGGAEKRLTDSTGKDDGPEYTRDGQYIYFNSDRTGSMQIWRMKPDGSAQEQVTKDDVNNWFPHISPNGQQMVFVTYEKGVVDHPENKDVQLRLMNLRTGAITVLAKLFGGQGTINVPSWSPNGQYIAFMSYQIVPAVAAAPAGRAADAPATKPSAAATGLRDPGKKDIAMQLVSAAENSSLDWKAQYGYIEYNVEGNAKENRGYTGGIVGFTSKTHDMLELVEYYNTIAPGNVLASYLPALRQVDGTSSQAGLGKSFERDWKAAGQDPKFRQAQDHERDRVYFDPAVDQAQRDGLRALGQFIYYDAIVMHGPGEDPDSFGGIRSAAMKSAKTPAQSGDETAYLNAFLDARKAAMQMEEGHADTTRVDTMQRVFLRAGNLDLNPPLSFKVYRDSYKISDASQT